MTDPRVIPAPIIADDLEDWRIHDTDDEPPRRDDGYEQADIEHDRRCDR